VKEIDETPLPENESECPCCAALAIRVATLAVEVADLHHRRRVSRQQAVDQDPEWY